MSSMESLDDLMQDELKDIYDAEKQLAKALPKLAKNASNEELRQALRQHLQETQGHVERLEQIFDRLGMPPRAKKCEGMKHLIDEGNTMIGDAEEEGTRDAVLIAAAQKCEHYEIASYGTLRTWANVLGKTEIAALLADTLDEEKEADRTLTAIAESFVNQEAAEEGDRGTSTRDRRGAGARQAAADRGGRPATRGRSR